MELVPTQPQPNQAFAVLLNNQSCELRIYQKAFGLYMDILVSNELIIGGVICQNLNRIKRSQYFAFQGDFIFVDTEGTSDPNYSGLGSRYQLIYLEPADLP